MAYPSGGKLETNLSSKALPLAKLKKLSTPFVSLLHACDRAENLCFPSFLFLYTHGATGCFRGSLVPFSTDPPLRVSSSFLPAIFLFTFYVLLAFQFVFFLAYPSFSLVYPFLLYFFHPSSSLLHVFFLPFQILSSSSESPCPSLSLLISCLFSNNSCLRCHIFFFLFRASPWLHLYLFRVPFVSFVSPPTLEFVFSLWCEHEVSQTDVTFLRETNENILFISLFSFFELQYLIISCLLSFLFAPETTKISSVFNNNPTPSIFGIFVYL